ncbi:hypothetical protein AUTU_44210 (plasmid) [Aureibacter tunicatorum]|nr:hypothetical protein AUTU_44210 [Aureibacter tunicatorum]
MNFNFTDKSFIIFNMKKLILFFLLSCLIVGVHAVLGKSIQESESPNSWIWVHANDNRSEKEWRDVLTKISDSGIEGILFGGSPEQVRNIAPLTKEFSLSLHAWMWGMNRPDLAEKHPEWLSVNQNGESIEDKKAYVDYYKFMCPAIPGVKDFLKELVEDYASIEELDGIHLDYIRYVDVILPTTLQPKYDINQDKAYPEWDYGYHPYLVEKYKSEYGIDPLTLENPENDQQWLQFRFDQVTEVVDELTTLAHNRGKLISSAVFPSPSMSREMVYQDWGKWKLDFYFPMVYHNFYNAELDWVGEQLKEGVETVDGDVFGGMFIPAFSEKGELKKALEIAEENGAKGISIFDYNSVKDHQWEEIKSALK